MNHFAFIRWRKKHVFVLSLFPSLVMLPCVNCSDSSPFPGTGQGCVRDTRQAPRGPHYSSAPLRSCRQAPERSPQPQRRGGLSTKPACLGKRSGLPRRAAGKAAVSGRRGGRGHPLPLRARGQRSRLPPGHPLPPSQEPPPTARTRPPGTRHPPAGRHPSSRGGEHRGPPGRGPGPPAPRGELRARPPRQASARGYDLARVPPAQPWPPAASPFAWPPAPLRPSPPQPSPGPGSPPEAAGAARGQAGRLAALAAGVSHGGAGARGGGGRGARGSRPGFQAGQLEPGGTTGEAAEGRVRGGPAAPCRWGRQGSGEAAARGRGASCGGAARPPVPVTAPVRQRRAPALPGAPLGPSRNNACPPPAPRLPPS